MTSLNSQIARLPVDGFLLLLIATVALAAYFPAHGAATSVVDQGVTAAVALLFLLYGARLAPSAIWSGLRNWRLQSVVLASTYCLFPLLGVALTLLLRGHLPADAVTGLLFLCLLPSTVQSSVAFTSIARGNVPAALCSASLSNVLGVVLTPLLVSLLLPAAGGGFSLHAYESIAREILLPFILGQMIRPWSAAWLLRHPLMTAVVDRGSVLVVVYAAFSAGMAAGIWHLLSINTLLAILAIDLAILAVVIVATTGASRRLAFSTEDEIATVFCGSKKSLAGGIPMAVILFPGHAVGLIVLPLMLFHQAQLFVCAALARRYARRSASAAGADAISTALVPPKAKELDMTERSAEPRRAASVT